MIEKIYKFIFGDENEKKIKTYADSIKYIKEKEAEFNDFDEKLIKEKTLEFRNMFEGLDFKVAEDSLKIKEILEEIKYAAFALVMQATKLLNGKSFDLPSGKKMEWNMIPYDVQLIGGLAIHDGNIGEMKTGEGKTLVATLPAYLNALTGNTVHIITVNDYLAKRDTEEMGVLYNLLGMTCGVVSHDQSKEEKQAAYRCDIVYATNNELGFDYLRDNMVTKKEDKSQSRLFFGIIDEVDSILIDEARTPLIISMPDNEPTSKYLKFATLAKELKKGMDYKVDEKQKAVPLTEDGIKKIEKLLHIENIYVSNHYNDLHHIENALKARAVYEKDKDYIVTNDEVMIVDEHTGRVLSGRRYSDGLHQAIEAKESVKIMQESKTLASITFQNFFRMYWKLSGMTGTAKTEEEEFYKVYALDTVVIPTNKPIIREDRKDLLFKNEKGKFDYVVRTIKQINKSGQPILVGTVSVEKSEYLSNRLRQEGIVHNVLNAKRHEEEADVIGNAGKRGAITIATNMAGRGTDIKLGEGVKKLGGLIILGTEKHETRRIDNQLRGRAGRQGDAGMTQFMISPNDDIMRIFGGDKLFSVFNSPMFASLPDDQPLAQSSMLTRKVTSVQKQVEGHNFDIRKHILEYDDVINKHREIIYTRRNKILNSENIHEDIEEMVRNQVSGLVMAEYTRQGLDIDKKEIIKKVNDFLAKEIIDDKIENDDIDGINDSTELGTYVAKIALEELSILKSEAESLEYFSDIERKVVLQSIDELWMRHIDSMSKLREEVAFEGFAQRNPLVVYKEKAYDKFRNLIHDLEYRVVKMIFSVNSLQNIEQINISDSDIELNEKDLENMLDSFAGKNNPNKPAAPAQSGNPLFVNPANSPKKSSGKKKIRV